MDDLRSPDPRSESAFVADTTHCDSTVPPATLPMNCATVLPRACVYHSITVSVSAVAANELAAVEAALRPVFHFPASASILSFVLEAVETAPRPWASLSLSCIYNDQ